MILSKEEKYNLCEIIFLDQNKSILRAEEYNNLRSNLSRSDLRKVEKNFKEIARHAAKYFVDNYFKGDDLNITDKQIQESIRIAVLAVLKNG